MTTLTLSKEQIDRIVELSSKLSRYGYPPTIPGLIDLIGSIQSRKDTDTNLLRTLEWFHDELERERKKHDDIVS